MNTVFFDIDSQLDFLFPAGALYVPGAERIVPAIARLNRFAAAHGIPGTTRCANQPMVTVVNATNPNASRQIGRRLA